MKSPRSANAIAPDPDEVFAVLDKTDTAFTIRKARPDEAAYIAALIRRAFESQCRLYDDWTIPPMNETETSVLEALETGLVLVAEADGAIIGSVRAVEHDDVTEIGRLVVEPGQRGRGIGRALVIAVEQACPNATRFEIMTGHRSDRALALYESLGYERYRTEPVHTSLELVCLAKPGPTA